HGVTIRSAAQTESKPRISARRAASARTEAAARPEIGRKTPNFTRDRSARVPGSGGAAGEARARTARRGCPWRRPRCAWRRPRSAWRRQRSDRCPGSRGPGRSARPLPRSRRRRVSWRPCHLQRLAVVLDPERLEPGAGAGALDAEAGVRLEHGPVGRADQVAAVFGEELFGPPIERVPGVGTAIDVGVVATVVVHDEAGHGPPVTLEPERRRRARSERAGRAAPRGGRCRRFHALLLPDRLAPGNSFGPGCYD